MSYHSWYQQAVTPDSDHDIVVGEMLFAWRGAGIVLLGERDGANWVLARGWRVGDRLTDVRRWSFADSGRFVTQVRRLVLEATANSSHAVDAANAAAGWIHLRLRERADAL
jgi:hypothetical protein